VIVVAGGRSPATRQQAATPLRAAELRVWCAPRGIRTPNRQIRSQPTPMPSRPPGPFASPLVQVNGHIAEPSRASVPACPAWLSRNVVAVSAQRRQTGCLATGRAPGRAGSRAPDSGSGALPSRGREPAAALVEKQAKQTRPSRGLIRRSVSAASQSAMAPRRSQLPASVPDGRLQLPTSRVCLFRCALGPREANWR
jgi:hypothetical protein